MAALALYLVRAPMSPARPSTWTAAPSCSSRERPLPPGIQGYFTLAGGQGAC